MDSAHPPTPTAAAPLPSRTIRYYGLGQAAEGIKNNAFSAYLLFYYTSVLGLSGTLAGAALLIALVFDAVTDPMAAVISDRTHSRWGRRHPFLFVSALPLGVFFYLCFAPPAGMDERIGMDPQWFLFAWLTSFAVLTRAAMTFFHVPHMALGAELSQDFDERNRVVAVRSLMAVLGTTASVVVYFVLVDLHKSPALPDGRLAPEAYRIFAAIFGVVMALVVLASAWGTRDHIPHLRRPDAQAGRQAFWTALIDDSRAALRLRSFRALFLGFTLCFVAFGTGNSLGAHNALYFWKISIEQQGAYGLALLTGTLLGMGYWKRHADCNDKHPALLRGLAIFLFWVAMPPLLKLAGFFPAESSALYFPLFALTGFLWSFGIAAALVVVGSMMADITDEDELLNDRRREGIFFGAISFSGKAATGIGTALGGLVYDAVGLYQGLDPSQAPVSIERQLGLVTSGALCGLVGLSFLFFRGYTLSRERHAAIRAELDARTPAGAAVNPA